MDQREKILDKIQKLMAKAESTTEAERAALLEKVEAFMVEYAIADHEINQLHGTVRSKPIKHSFTLYEGTSPFWYELSELAMACCDFFNCKSVFGGLIMKGKYPIQCHAVGFEADTRNAEFLFRSLYLQLMNTMIPKYDPSKDFMANMVAFKAAGLGWKQMYEIMRRAGVERCQDPNPPRSVFVNYTKIYADHCRANGIEQVKINPKNYQMQFAEAFTNTVIYKIQDIIQVRKKNKDTTSDGTSVALVLASREDEVKDAYREFFPNVGKGVSKSSGKYNSAARGAGAEAGRNADLGGSSVAGSRKALTQ